MADEELRKRFFARVQKGAKDKCWLWPGAKSVKGYGILTYRGKRIAAHRLSWCLQNNVPIWKLTSENYVTHDCDNPPCVNPNHLRLGDGISNNAETTARKRRAYGEKNPTSKLTEAAVRDIRKNATTWEGMCDAMKKYRVSQGTIQAVLKRKMWKHIP